MAAVVPTGVTEHRYEVLEVNAGLSAVTIAAEGLAETNATEPVTTLEFELIVVELQAAEVLQSATTVPGTVIAASGKVMTRVPEVEAPAVRKLLVPGVPEVPAK